MKKEFKIEGIKCEGCIARIRKVLENVKGITTYNISLENKTLNLEVKKEKTITEVIDKIENLGFKVIK